MSDQILNDDPNVVSNKFLPLPEHHPLTKNPVSEEELDEIEYLIMAGKPTPYLMTYAVVRRFLYNKKS